MTLYLFVDVETTGLNFTNGNSKPRKNRMLQLAYKLYDEQIQKEYSSGNFFVKYTDAELVQIHNEMDEYVLNMHTSTGLLDKLKSSNTTSLEDIDNHLYNLLEQYPGHRYYLAGNNVQFDYEVVRRYLPKTASKLHYSLFEISSIRRIFSTIGSDFGEKTKAQKASNHDALVDIKECVKELKTYQDVIRKAIN